MLCSNDSDRLYDTFGLVLDIFGDAKEKRLKEKLERLVTLDLNVDEENELVLTNNEKILDEPMKRNQELQVVDQYFRTNAPIIHQSPFNEETV